jgi:hypothetical protein
MKLLFLTLLSYFYGIYACYAQFYMGINYNIAQTQNFDWQTGSSFEQHVSHEQGIGLAYHFKRKEKKYHVCYQLATGVSVYQRFAKVGNMEYTIDFIDIPILWGVNIPRTLEGQSFPLFDVILTSGYHFGIPQRSNYTNDVSATAFTNHGIISNIGLALYTNRGAKLEMAFSSNLDLGTLNKPNNTFTPQKFMTKGLRIGFSVPLMKSLFKLKGK